MDKKQLEYKCQECFKKDAYIQSLEKTLCDSTTFENLIEYEGDRGIVGPPGELQIGQRWYVRTKASGEVIFIVEITKVTQRVVEYFNPEIVYHSVEARAIKSRRLIEDVEWIEFVEKNDD